MSSHTREGKAVKRGAGPFYLASLLAVPPRDEAVVECGGGGQHVVGVGRHEGGREGGGVVREEVSRRGLAGAVDGASPRARGATAYDSESYYTQKKLWLFLLRSALLRPCPLCWPR